MLVLIDGHSNHSAFRVCGDGVNRVLSEVSCVRETCGF